jgi:hypothetical protein
MTMTLSHTNSEFARIATTDASGNVTGVTVQDFAVANLANFSIPGGNAGQVLSTDGTGVLSWANAAGGTVSVGAGGSDTFTATAGQVLFTTTSTPNGVVAMTINGIQVATTAATNVGTAVTYVPAQNAGYALKAGDRVVLSYIYGSTSVANIGGLSDVVITTPTTGQVLSFDAGTSKWLNTAAASAFGNVASGTSNVSVAPSGNVTVGVAGTANVATFTAGGLTIPGNLSVTGANVFLGDVANVQITGGTAGQALVSLGGGDVAFTNTTRLVTYAYAISNLTLLANFVPTIVKYTEKLHDPQALYDVVTGRFQPKVAGWYQITATASVYVNNTSEQGLLLKHSVDGNFAQTSSFGLIGATIVGAAYFNGTTDYAWAEVVVAAAGTRGQYRGSAAFTATYLSI